MLSPAGTNEYGFVLELGAIELTWPLAIQPLFSPPNVSYSFSGA